MSIAFDLLSVAALLGAVDVLYFHIYRFRLYAQPASVAEEVTHLARGGIFIAIVALIAFSDGGPTARLALLVLAGADLANNVADVLLERRSRAPLGGLPSLEYLIHVLGSFLTGVAVAAIWFTSSADGFAPLPDGTYQIRAWLLLAGGVAMFALEGALFARALSGRCRMVPA